MYTGLAVEIVQGQKPQIIPAILAGDRNIDIVNFHVIPWMACYRFDYELMKVKKKFNPQFNNHASKLIVTHVLTLQNLLKAYTWYYEVYDRLYFIIYEL